jgi:hypothetical protein
MNAPSHPQASLAVMESVRCLDCGAVYSKPSGGGTPRQNPGCPDCGYLGWISTAVPVTPSFERRRSVADLPPRRQARSG